VDWAEYAMMESDFDDKDYDTIREIISHLGFSDVKAFGLSWEDCEAIIEKSGYKVSLTFEYA